jgi:hypothetical protein
MFASTSKKRILRCASPLKSLGFLGKTMNDLDLIEVTEDSLICTQHKDRNGVCIIPAKQLKAAKKLLKLHNRKLVECEGSKRTSVLKFIFEPTATEDEAEAMEQNAL